MSREIKFRTFLGLRVYDDDKDCDEYIDGLIYNATIFASREIGFSKKDAIDTFGEKAIDEAIENNDLMTDEDGDWIWLFDHYYGVEQFANMQDVNGKEIYENDIIKIYMDNGKVKYGVIEWNDDYHGWSVAYYNHENDKYASALKNSTEIEIVGNVHNKKLVEEIKKWNI